MLLTLLQVLRAIWLTRNDFFFFPKTGVEGHQGYYLVFKEADATLDANVYELGLRTVDAILGEGGPGASNNPKRMKLQA